MGFAILVIAGLLNGSFTLPMKFMRKWSWENTWLAWTFFSLIVFPPLLAFSTLPGTYGIYQNTDTGIIVAVAGFGAGWGFSQIFFGLAVDALGIGLAVSVILGLSAAVGSVAPLIRLHPEKIATPGGAVVISGVLLVLIGVALCAAAGHRREGQSPSPPLVQTAIMKGLFFCLISGVGSALVNFGLAFGGPLLVSARLAGANTIWLPNAVWLPLMCAGALPNLLYCVYLLRRNKTGQKFTVPGTGSYWLLAAFMALCWFGSTILYGIAATTMGSLGTVLAWPVFMSLIVITASAWGVITGEWKHAGRTPVGMMAAGVGTLVIAVFMLSFASQRI